MAKRALLCGCNYPGSSHALNGCVNDVNAMYSMLTTHFGFAPENITKLIDTDPSGEQPTGANIKRHLTEMVAASQPGDVLFFHYSGHGTQVPSDHEEADAKDEALCPTDMNTITDDDLRTIFVNLADGVKLTVVADCCHSGTLLDQPEVQISVPKSVKLTVVADCCHSGTLLDQSEAQISGPKSDLQLLLPLPLPLLLLPLLLLLLLLLLPPGVKLTVVADCCHSGTLLDQPEVQINGPKSDDPAAPPQLVDTFTAAAGGADNRDVGCRALPVDAFVAALGEKLGVAVAPNQARAAMVAAFGSDASAKLGPLIQKFQGALDAAGGAEALAAQATAKLDELVPGAGGALGGLLGGVLGGGGGGSSGSRGIGSSLFSLALEMLGSADVAQQLPPAGAKPSPDAQLPPGRGLLITGCQAEETSADACPSGDASQAFGALTNALTTTVNQFKQAYPDQNISARTLVAHIRESLNAARFAQNPCLECDAANADAPFVLGA
uniref:Peptidase C14 caspase domain-containing protein n=1 Tax=Tetradesmus obliquus TaxID=3088 RepID=A0A383VPH1_TETOB|eukprot:jgi/Sobl393_1/9159/SZX67071.1